MGEILPFTAMRGAKSYRVEFVLFEGRRRRQWVVVERLPDGTETGLPVYRGRKCEAEFMATLYTRNEARRLRERETLASHPLWDSVMRLPPESRDLLRHLLNYEERNREDA
ncbi:hypothetical protein ACVINZ_000959 [Mesorhizobium jarvisii]